MCWPEDYSGMLSTVVAHGYSFLWKKVLVGILTSQAVIDLGLKFFIRQIVPALYMLAVQK